MLKKCKVRASTEADTNFLMRNMESMALLKERNSTLRLWHGIMALSCVIDVRN